LYTPEKWDRVIELKKEIVESCEVCGGSGYIPGSSKGKVTRCDCMIVYRYLKSLVRANIMSDYWNLSLTKMEINDEYKTIVKNYVQKMRMMRKKGNGLVFLGPNGVGKTSSMAVIGKEAIIRNYEVRYFTLANYVEAFTKQKDEVLEDIDRSDFVLLDELDKVYQKSGSDYVLKTVDDFLRNCFNKSKSVLLATNWTKEELSENFGQSTVSLLNRRCLFVIMDGQDYGRKIQGGLKRDINRFFEDVDYMTPTIVEEAMRMESTFAETYRG